MTMSRELMGKIVDEVFDGAIEDVSVIEQIYEAIKKHDTPPPSTHVDASQLVITKGTVWSPKTAPKDLATRLVIVESPFAGDVEANIAYARAALRDCLDRGEAPYASHLLYTQPGVLDDNDADQRRHGIEAGLAWGRRANATVVYTDRGVSAGMQQGIDRAKAEGRAIEYRSIKKAAAE